MKMVLFDLDGTLLVTRGIGRSAFERAGQATWGQSFTLTGCDVAGRLDSQLFYEACAIAGIVDPLPLFDTFKARYHEELKQLLGAEKNATAPRNVQLPNVDSVLESISRMADVTLGILTGNFPQAARIKLESVGLNRDCFQIAVFGDEAQTRPQLVQLAFKKFGDQYHFSISPKDVLIIGDTPRDIQCALENNCPCLAVATGRYTAGELSAAGATWAIPDLTDPQILWQWLRKRSA